MRGWQAQGSACDHSFVFHLPFSLGALAGWEEESVWRLGKQGGLQSSDQFLEEGQEIPRDPDSAGMGTKGVEWRGKQGPSRKASLSTQEGDPSQPTDQIRFDFD